MTTLSVRLLLIRELNRMQRANCKPIASLWQTADDVLWEKCVETTVVVDTLDDLHLVTVISTFGQLQTNQ